MEELETTTNDLASLLSSTDIAVLFLDTRLRIRRFTPAATKLMDLIAGDVGRPVSDLAARFTDPHLVADVQSVLQTLVPAQKEVPAEGDRVYVRRILPYRTVDNRIDGVVVTFIDVTDLKHAEGERAESDSRLAAELRAMRVLQVLGSITMGSADWPAAFEQIVRAAVELHAADMGTIQLVDPETHALSLVAQQGFDANVARGWAAADGAPATACAQVLQTGRRVHVEDVETEPAFAELRPIARQLGFRSLHATPLRSAGGALVGVLTTYFAEPLTLSEDQLRVTEMFARYASDLLDRMRAEEELSRLLQTEQAARRALGEAARTKDEFLATLSHELRTPLGVILLWGRMLRDGLVAGDQASDGVEAIVRSAEAQQRLIEDLLDTSRLATGKLRLDLGDTDLAAVVEAAVDSIAATADLREVRLETEIDPALGHVHADAGRLRQVLWNLLTNAVKFTQPGGVVRVRASRSGRHVHLTVSDDGVGIAPEFLPFVFERFRQYDSSLSRKHGGLGLGLAITKQLVEMHGGVIEAESGGLGRGATFTVRIPLPPIERHVEPARAGSASASDLRGVRVLLVEDDATTTAVVTLILQQSGALVTPAPSAAEALERFRCSEVDVIVSDLGLPETDGLSLLRQVRDAERQAGRRSVPAVALTAHAREQDRQEALRAGYAIHLGKPVDRDKLLGAVRGVLSGESEAAAQE